MSINAPGASRRARLSLREDASVAQSRIIFRMTATDIINQLPNLSEAERRLVLGKLLELEDLPLSPEDEELVESRLAGHRVDPASSVQVDDMKRRLRSRDSRES